AGVGHTAHADQLPAARLRLRHAARGGVCRGGRAAARAGVRLGRAGADALRCGDARVLARAQSLAAPAIDAANGDRRAASADRAALAGTDGRVVQYARVLPRCDTAEDARDQV